MRFDFGVSDKRRPLDDDLLSLHYLGTRPRAADGHVLPRIGAAYQADIPIVDGSLARPKTAVPTHAARSWSPLWMSTTRLFDSSGDGASAAAESSSGSSAQEQSLGNTKELAEFLDRVEQVSVDWRVGMRVGVPRPRGVIALKPASLAAGGPVSTAATPQAPSRIEPGVLLSWQRGSPARSSNPVAVPMQPSAGSQSLLSLSPAPGFAFVVVLSSASVLQVPLSALRVQSSDMVVTPENALLILTRCGGDVSLGLKEITRLTNLASSAVALGAATHAAVRTPGPTLLSALKQLAGCTEIAVVPRAPLLAPLVSAVSAAAATACSQAWTSSQQVAFAYSFNRFGKNFQLYRVPGKTAKECVRFYYSHKHSRMLISGMGFSSRNPSESRWRSVAAATAASLSGEERDAIAELGWKLGSDGVGSAAEAQSASAAAEDGKPVETLEEETPAALPPGAEARAADPEASEQAGLGSSPPQPPESETQDRVELATRSSRPVLYVRSSSLYVTPKPSERAALVQLATAVVCMGGSIGDVRAQLYGFVLSTYDTAPPPNSRQPLSSSELNELRIAQKPRSALDPLNMTRACSSCRKTSTNPMVCCNPQCCIVSCDVCFKLEVRVLPALLERGLLERGRPPLPELLVRCRCRRQRSRRVRSLSLCGSSHATMRGGSALAAAWCCRLVGRCSGATASTTRAARCAGRSSRPPAWRGRAACSSRTKAQTTRACRRPSASGTRSAMQGRRSRGRRQPTQRRRSAPPDPLPRFCGWPHSGSPRLRFWDRSLPRCFRPRPVPPLFTRGHL